MDAWDCDGDGVTKQDIVHLIGRFLPPGKAQAEHDGDEFVVSWAARDQPGSPMVARSSVSFDEAYHLLIAKCARQFLEHALTYSREGNS